MRNFKRKIVQNKSCSLELGRTKIRGEISTFSGKKSRDFQHFVPQI